MAENPSASSQQDPFPSSESRNGDGIVPTSLCDSLPVPQQGGIPTLRELSLLPVPNWYLVGLQLGISGDELDVIERNYPRDNDRCKVKMFGAWLRMDTTATYGKLTRALVAVGKRNIAEAMCTARGIPLTVLQNIPVKTVEPLPPTPTVPPEPPDCVANYAQYLKDKYKRMSTLPDGDWPPSLGRQYTGLAMIEQKRELPGAELVATMERDYIHGNIDNIVKRKKEIQLPEVFLPTEDGGQELKILMDGAPGVGKSTLCRKVCKDWASGELLKQYHVVILLPLRQASIREATSIEDLIEADDPDLKQQVVQHIQKTSGEHVLLIVDGYDEVGYKDRTKTNSLFLNIVRGNKFPKCSVLVTSRPYASNYLQQLQSVNRHVEVLGFTQEQIEHCIMQNIPDKDKATVLVQTLKERQDIVSLCYIPLNCAIVLYVYEKEQCTLPNSLTKLYEIFIMNTVKRHASITDDDSITMGLHTLAEIPKSFQKHLNALSKLAYDGLVVDKMVLSIKHIKAAFPDCTDLEIEHNLFGLMTVFKGFTSTGEELSYQFLHLTIQEFLAARWAASQLSAGELLKFFQDHLKEDRYRMVLLFLAGISQLSFPSVEIIFQDGMVYESTVPRNTKINYFLFLAHLIYESQNLRLFSNLAKTLEQASLYAAWYSLSPFDCLVLAHFLAWCDCSLMSLDLSCCGLTNQSLEIIHRVNLEHHGTTQIEEVDLSNNPKILITKLSLLYALPMFEYTKVFTACGLQCPEEASCVVGLLCMLNMRHLTTLDISVKASNICLSLGELQCQNANIESKNAIEIFRSLEHNTSLEKLDLSWNWKLAEGDSVAVGCAIERMLNVNRTLKVLNLSDCNLTDPTVKHIVTGLTKNTSLTALHLGSPKLSGSCAVSLFQQMTNSITVGEVNILGVGRVKMDRGSLWCVLIDTTTGHCAEFFRALNNSSMKVTKMIVQDLTDQTAEHFAVGLAESKWIQALKLTHCNLSSTGAVSIFRSLEHNTNLEELDLSESWQLESEAVGCAIKRMLNVNRTLKVLNLSECRFTSNVVSYFANGLAQNHSVKRITLHWNNIGSIGAVCIFRSLEHNTNLEELDLSESWQLESAVVGCAIKRMLNVNRTLKVLNLSECRFTSEVVPYFADGLAQNHSVKKITLHWNNIGRIGAVSMFGSLEYNTSLEELDLSGNRRLAEGDSEAVGCAIERMLNVNRTLKVLNLSNCELDTTMIIHTAAGLVHNVSLAELNIGAYIGNRDNITSEGWVHLFKALCNNTSLKKLDISYNKLGVKGSEALAEMLSCNKLLTELNLHSCNIPEAGLTEILAKGLLHNTSLKKLNISGNNLGMEGSVALADMLSCNKSLTELNLHSCNIPEAGLTEILAKGLLHNTSLKKLNITYNNLGMEGSVTLADTLSCNKSLTELNLQWCDIPEAGLREIARGLLHNTSLKKLNISGNNLGMEGSVALADMLSCNKSLTELNIQWCDIPEAGLREIARGLLTNTSLQTIVIGFTQAKTFLEAEIERLKKSGNFKSQSLRKIEIKAGW